MDFLPPTPAEYDARVNAFRQDAIAYCAFIEQMHSDTPNLYRTLEILLSRLVASGVALPFDLPDNKVDEVEYSMEMKAARSRTIHEAVDGVSQQMMGLPVQSEYEKVRSLMFFDDLSDLYMDLRTGLEQYDRDTEDDKAQAVWYWHLNYQIHWGEHLLRALSTVHDVRFRLCLP